MQKLSLVTAKVVRENEQYSYKLVGRGEKYLVRHADGENAGDKVAEYLAPFAKEPVVIEQVILQENHEIIGELTDDCVFKASIEFIGANPDTGKEKKVTRGYFVCADSIREAFDVLSEFLAGFVSDKSIASIVRTKIIEVL